VFTISNTFPAHPAGSFHYPHLPHLPRLAVYTLTKVTLTRLFLLPALQLREYELEKDFTAGGASGQTRQAKSSKYSYEVTAGGAQAAQGETIEFVPMEAAGGKEQAILSNEIPWYGNNNNNNDNNTNNNNKNRRPSRKKLSLGGSLLPSAGFRSASSAR
jgi:hypothetical protein